jgi:hypothetical protein
MILINGHFFLNADRIEYFILEISLFVGSIFKRYLFGLTFPERLICLKSLVLNEILKPKYSKLFSLRFIIEVLLLDTSRPKSSRNVYILGTYSNILSRVGPVIIILSTYLTAQHPASSL